VFLVQLATGSGVCSEEQDRAIMVG
jgi:hypothetical protein